MAEPNKAPPVEVKDLRRRFKTLNRREGLSGAFKDLFSRDYTYTDAVDGISFSLEEGEIVGFVGPNGAGKSTTIKMLTGVLEPTSGTALVNGLPPFKNRSRNAMSIGVVFGQRSQLWWDLPVIESFKVLKEIYRIPDDRYRESMAAFDELVNLKDLYRKQVRTMSLGQRMLCDIVAAFLHDPKIIFLDEPTIGLDISVKSKIRSLILELNKRRRTTIILTTHDIADIEALCKRIVIIDKGKIIYDGDLARVSGIVGAYRTLRLSFSQSGERDWAPELERDLTARFPVAGALGLEAEEDGWIAVTVNEEKVRLMDVLNAITAGYPVKDVKIEEIRTEHVIKKIYEGALT
jgi:ABC-2 type transport system ATP-binding protein